MGQASSSYIDNASATIEIPNQGKIVGRIAKDVVTGELKSQRYAGIPFAQPPVGSLRWRRPQPLPSTFRFDSEGKHYSDFASQCPQATNYALTNGVTFPNAPAFPQSEDCLYLNIWTPVQGWFKNDGQAARSVLYPRRLVTDRKRSFRSEQGPQ